MPLLKTDQRYRPGVCFSILDRDNIHPTNSFATTLLADADVPFGGGGAAWSYRLLLGAGGAAYMPAGRLPSLNSLASHSTVGPGSHIADVVRRIALISHER